MENQQEYIAVFGFLSFYLPLANYEKVSDMVEIEAV